MDRAIKEGNRVVNWKQLQKNEELHQQKISSTNKIINNDLPYAYKHK